MTDQQGGEERAPAGGPKVVPPSPARFAGLGLQLVLSILLFLYVGRWADAKLGTTPWLLVLGVFVGAGAGFYSLIPAARGAAPHGSPAVKAMAMYTVLAAALIAASGWMLTLVFPGSDAARAIRIAACVAIAVQLLAFGIARVMVRTNVVAGWGIGMFLRFATLAIFALTLLKAFALPAAATLVSLAMFFFVSTLVEPWLLKQ